MYRYSVDNAITYTSEDFVLYRESPFACWMERLTLENPDHGIPADLDSVLPVDLAERQDDIAETLRDEGRNVILVDWDAPEPVRRNATLEAMRKGADFVVNGQLALGPLSGAANLLMRTSGYSDLGDYLYVPCDTQGKTTLHSAFRLCFLADLLHMLQGQLSPQMLIIRGGSDVVPLETEEHIYHYRAVKQRFMSAMRDFRKHRMPDPAESSHFGRWSDCAHEVMKQRALNVGEPEENSEGNATENIADSFEEEAPQLVAGLGENAEPIAIQSEVDNGPQVSPVASVAASTRRAGELQVNAVAGGTLAEQASQLGSAMPSQSARRLPGHTPNLAPVMAKRPQASRPQAGARLRPTEEQTGGDLGPDATGLSDVALDNLEFIGRNLQRSAMPVIEREAHREFSSRQQPEMASERKTEATEARVEQRAEEIAEKRAVERAEDFPAAADPDSEATAYSFPEQGASLDASLDSSRDARSDREEQVPQGEELTTLADTPFELPATRVDRQHPLDSPGISARPLPGSVVDRDDSRSVLPDAEPRPINPAPRFSWDALEEEGGEGDFLEATVDSEVDEDKAAFSNSLITNGEFGDRD